ncbi:TPA: hypothetical protein U0K61_001732 [Streptococcus suis]|nr:hypothetical protein [Streptococcus suis]
MKNIQVGIDIVCKDFREWLKGHLSDNSIPQYITYVKNALSLLHTSELFPESESYYHSFVLTPKNRSAEYIKNQLDLSLLILYSNEIQKVPFKNQDFISSKDLSNARSGFQKFIDFIYEFKNEDGCQYRFEKKLINNDKLDLIREKLGEENQTLTLSKNLLTSRFRNRLVTQDRAYSNFILNVRLLNQLFSGEEKYKSILNTAIGEVQFIISKSGDTVTLNEISQLQIIKDKLVLFSNGRRYSLYTEKFKGKTGDKTYVKMVKPSLSEMSLDHDIPLENILNTEQSRYEFPTLFELSEQIKEYIARKDSTLPVSGIKGGEISKELYENLSKYWSDKEFTNKLLDDYSKLFKDYITLTVMDKRENSRKNKN